MAIANPMAFHNPVPYFSQQGACCREGQGNEQCHCDSRRPAILGRWVATPNYADTYNCGQAVEQCERQKLSQINVGTIAAKRMGDLSDRNAMLLSDLFKQSLHACIPFGFVILARSWAMATKVSVGISDRKIFRELCVRTEMVSINRMTGGLSRPSAVGIKPVATDASARAQHEYNRDHNR